MIIFFMLWFRNLCVMVDKFFWLILFLFWFDMMVVFDLLISKCVRCW